MVLVFKGNALDWMEILVFLYMRTALSFILQLNVLRNLMCFSLILHLICQMYCMKYLTNHLSGYG